MSREDLALELIPFGQKHQGETFLTAWQDQEWVSFMVSRYQTHKASSSSFHSARRTAGGTLRAGTDSPDSRSISGNTCPDSSAQGKGQCATQDDESAGPPGASGFGQRTRGRGGMGADDHPLQCRLRDRSGHEAGAPEHGRGVDASHAPSKRSECPADPGLVSNDTEDSICTTVNMEVKGMQQMIIQFEKELQSVVSETSPMGNRWTLGEIFCSQQSPLTQQVQQIGRSAFRFGYSQGDLATAEGRSRLFHMIARHRPNIDGIVPYVVPGHPGPNSMHPGL